MTIAPPYNTDAEKSFLSAIFIDTKVIYDTDIVASDFYHDAHRTIYDALKEEAETNTKIDIISIVSLLEDKNKLKSVGGATYISNIASNVYSVVHAPKHAKLIKEASKKRKLLELCHTTIDHIENRDKSSEVLARMEQGFTTILEDTLQYEGYKNMKDMTASAYNLVMEAYNNEGSITGLKTGYPYLDKLLTGLKPEQLIVLAARPGVGKSALALNMAYNIASDGKAVGIVSLEMSSDELLTRLFASETGISGQNIKNGTLKNDDISRLGVGIDALNKLKIYVDDSPTSTFPSIKSKSRQLKRINDLDLLIVDYLQLITLGERKKNKYEEVTEISRGFKMLAKELRLPIILLSQLSRQVEQREDKEPKLSDLRDSGAIEQDANIVLMLDRKVSSEDPDEIRRARLFIRKNRGGSCGVVDLEFVPETTTFKKPTLRRRVIEPIKKEQQTIVPKQQVPKWGQII